MENENVLMPKYAVGQKIYCAQQINFKCYPICYTIRKIEIFDSKVYYWLQDYLYCEESKVLGTSLKQAEKAMRQKSNQ